MRQVRLWIAAGIVALGCGGEGVDDPDVPFRFDAIHGVDAAVNDPGAGDDSAAPGDTAGDPGDPGGPATDPGPADPGGKDGNVISLDLGPSDPGPSDPGPSDEGPGDPGTDPGPPCNLGPEICLAQTGSGDGEKCGTAGIVPRLIAQTENGYTVNPDLGDYDDDSDTSDCWDAGSDAFWRVWLEPGELLSVQMVNHPDIDVNLKLFRGTACAKADRLSCTDNDQAAGEYESEAFGFTADQAGWYTVVADCATADEFGKVLVKFFLFNCADKYCCCG